MDISSVIAELEAAITNQLQLAGDDPGIEAAGSSLLVALAPAIHQAAMKLAEQAATEVAAQLPEYRVDVVLSEGEPSLVIRSDIEPMSFTVDDLEARLTLRLPAMLKDHLESAAGEVGDSVNSYVVKSLSKESARSKQTSRRFKGTVQT